MSVHRAVPFGKAEEESSDPEKTLARVCEEAGATVRCNAKFGSPVSPSIMVRSSLSH